MLISDSKIEIAAVQRTEYTGTVVLSLTLDRVLQPGRPRSRAKDQKTRDVEASIPTVAQLARMTMMADMTVAPARELVACSKMYM